MSFKLSRVDCTIFVFLFFLLMTHRRGEPLTSLCGTLGFRGTQVENHLYKSSRILEGDPIFTEVYYIANRLVNIVDRNRQRWIYKCAAYKLSLIALYAIFLTKLKIDNEIRNTEFMQTIIRIT